MTTLYLLSGIVMFVLRFFTTWTPALLLSSWSAKSKWILFLAYLCAGLIILLIAVVDGARRIHLERIAPLNATIESQKWLGELEETDQADIGSGVAITQCEIFLDLESRQPYVEFGIKVFNGSVFPMVEINSKGMAGFISFADGKTKPLELHENLKMDHGSMGVFCARHSSAYFRLHQALSKADAAFVSAESSRDGYFLFDNLVIMVKGASDRAPAARLHTSANDVRPKLKEAFRYDASALEAERKERDARIHALILAKGMSEQVYLRLNRSEMRSDSTTENTIKNWQSDVIEALRRGYPAPGEAQIVFESFSNEFPICETDIGNQRRWIGNFLERLTERIDHENKIRP